MADDKDIHVKAVRRESTGKNESRRLRAAGMVPLTIYGGEGEPFTASAPLAELAAILRSHSGSNTVFTLDVEGIGASEVLFQDRHIDPVKSRLIHADLKRLVRGQEIEVTVPLHLMGEPVGVKSEGGVLEQSLRQVHVRCRPRSIPDEIAVDVEHLAVHDILHVSDLPENEDYKILDDPETVIATIGIITEEELAESLAPAEDAVEPELITDDKDVDPDTPNRERSDKGDKKGKDEGQR